MLHAVHIVTTGGAWICTASEGVRLTPDKTRRLMCASPCQPDTCLPVVVRGTLGAHRGACVGPGPPGVWVGCVVGWICLLSCFLVGNPSFSLCSSLASTQTHPPAQHSPQAAAAPTAYRIAQSHHAPSAQPQSHACIGSPPRPWPVPLALVLVRSAPPSCPLLSPRTFHSQSHPSLVPTA